MQNAIKLFLPYLTYTSVLASLKQARIKINIICIFLMISSVSFKHGLSWRHLNSDKKNQIYFPKWEQLHGEEAVCIMKIKTGFENF